MWRLLALAVLGLANGGIAAHAGNDAARAGNDARRRATAAAGDAVEAARRSKIIEESAGTIDHLRKLMCGRVSDEALTIGVTVGADAQELTEKLRAHLEQQRLKVLSSRKTRDHLYLAGQTVGFDFRVESKYDAAVGTSTTAYWQELAAAHSEYRVVLVLGSAHEAPSHDVSIARLKRCSTSTDMKEADQLIAAFGSACPSPRQRAKVEDQVVAEILETVPSDRLQVYDASLTKMDALKWRGWWENGKSFITKTTSSDLIVCPGSGATATRALQRGLNAAGFGDQNPIPRLRTHKVDHNSAREFLRNGPEDDAYDFGVAFSGDSAVLDTPVPGIWPELLAAFPSHKVVLTIREEYKRDYPWRAFSSRRLGTDEDYCPTLQRCEALCDGLRNYTVPESLLADAADRSCGLEDPKARDLSLYARGPALSLLGKATELAPLRQTLRLPTVHAPCPSHLQAVKMYRNTNRHVVRRVASSKLITLNVVDDHDGFERLCPFLGCGEEGPLPRVEHQIIRSHRSLMSMHHCACALAARQLPDYELPSDFPSGGWWDKLSQFKRVWMLDDARRQIRVFASAHEAGEFIQKHERGKDHPGRHVANAASTGTKRYGHYWAYENRRLTLEEARNSVTIQSWAPAIEYKQRHGDAIKGKTEFGRRRRVDEELRTSVRMFRPKHPATAVDILKRLFGDLREHALLILNGRIYATRYFLGLERQFLGYEKNQGHVALLASALRHGAKFPNVAMAHTGVATGGDDERCVFGHAPLPPLPGRDPDPDPDVYAVPTTVIAKRHGYAQCGILVPNPYFGVRRYGALGDLGLWHRETAQLRYFAKRRPLQHRDKRAFWRGGCGGGARPSRRLDEKSAFHARKEQRKQAALQKREHEKAAYHAEKAQQAEERRIQQETLRERKARREAAKKREREAKDLAYVARKAAFHTMKHQKECDDERGNRARLLAASLTVAAPDSFDVKCSKYEAMVHNFSACVSPKRDAELRAARSTTVVQQDLILDNSWFEPEDYARYAHVLNLPGQTTGSYSRNLNHLWATGAVVHMWDSDIVEWYYPGLIPGESMVVVDRDTAQATVRKLNENPELMTALAAGGLRIDRELVCPHCIADYLRRAFTSIRDETGLGEVVDDLGLVRRLAAENGTACDDFVEVIIRDRKTGADAVTSKPAVEAGDSLCNVLARGG